MFHLACGLDPVRFRPSVVVPGEGSLSQSLRARGVEVRALDLPRIAWNSSHRVAAALRRLLTLVDRLDIDLVTVGCIGYCCEEPLVNITLPKKPLVILHRVTEADQILHAPLLAQRGIAHCHLDLVFA